MHISIPQENTIKFISATEISPLISKVVIKVLYTGGNRNHTLITHEVAEEIGKKLPGSPIVGAYQEETKDFNGHDRDYQVDENGELKVIDLTQPYGFVDINAKVWFQNFLDDDGVIREYLCTEAYIWTEAYPAAQRIAEEGNNQSMELHQKTLKGNWSGNIKDNNRFFIINEAIIEKLCILGEDVEPCFEGAQIKATFSLEEEFESLRTSMFALMKQVTEGGQSMTEIKLNEAVQEEEVFEIKEEAPATIEEPAVEENPAPAVEEFAKDEKKEECEEPAGDENAEEDDEDKKKKTEHSLDNSENIQYNKEEMENKISELTGNYNALEEKYNALLAEVEGLREFKLSQDRIEKQNMINNFYMLSDEDKKEVVDNIDNYSLSDIEAKLSVICFRNKVNFNLSDEAKNTEVPMTFNLNSVENEENNVPEWVKAVKQTASQMD